jgi:hypothetical protein
MTAEEVKRLADEALRDAIGLGQMENGDPARMVEYLKARAPLHAAIDALAARQDEPKDMNAHLAAASVEAPARDETPAMTGSRRSWPTPPHTFPAHYPKEPQ